jgi:hypothetical protein
MRCPAERAERNEETMTDQGASLSYEQNIKPMFRDKDRERMEWAFDLWSHADVSANADAILERLEDGDMPCDGPWAAEQIETFKRWVEGGREP